MRQRFFFILAALLTAMVAVKAAEVYSGGVTYQVDGSDMTATVVAGAN